MSCSKPLPPFVCDSLYYLNRNQLERFSIVCRFLKNFIKQYLHSKPYRVFDALHIRGGSYALLHNGVQWHPNRDDYSAQQFLAGEALQPRVDYCSFAEMHPYLGKTVRIEKTWIHLDIGTTYNPEQMESIAHVWCDRKISVWSGGRVIGADLIQLILDSPIILQCRFLSMHRAHFPFKDNKVLYNAKIIENVYFNDETDPDYWPQFLEQPGVKPLVALRGLYHESFNTLVDHLSEAFSAAVSPNSFKIVFANYCKSLTEFRKTNDASGEKLELKKGSPIEYQSDGNGYIDYTLERSSI